MILHIKDAIEPNTLEAVIESIDNDLFVDGTETAGRAVKGIKNNQQIRLRDGQPAPLQLLLNRLQNHPLIQHAALPQKFTHVMLNRYQSNMTYGDHIDDAIMSGVRTDISFTLGLSDKYQGGELVLHDSTGERSWRLGCGELLLYPTHYLHRVNPVTSGQRTSMVGWIQSYVRDSQQRELLFDLKQSLNEEFEQRGTSEQYLRLSKSYNNLLRYWSF